MFCLSKNAYHYMGYLVKNWWSTFVGNYSHQSLHDLIIVLNEVLPATRTQPLRNSFNNKDYECQNLFCKLFLLYVAKAVTKKLNNLGNAFALRDCLGIDFNSFAEKFCKCDGDVSVHSLDEVFWEITDLH